MAPVLLENISPISEENSLPAEEVGLEQPNAPTELTAPSTNKYESRYEVAPISSVESFTPPVRLAGANGSTYLTPDNSKSRTKTAPAATSASSVSRLDSPGRIDAEQTMSHRGPGDSSSEVGGGRNLARQRREILRPVYDTVSYRIRPGDLLDVFVWGQQELSQKARVARDGTIVVRLAGAVRIEGLTVNEASSIVRNRLSRYLIEPAVTISIAEFSGKDILIVGEVAKPGPFSVDRPTSLLDALLQANWKHDAADISHVRLVRGDSVFHYDIAGVLQGRNVEQNVMIEPGDMIIVPSREKKISLLGAFDKPGKYAFALNRTVTVKDLLLDISTWKPNADLKEAFVLRPDGTMDPVDINALWFHGDGSQNKELKMDDSFVIPELLEIGVYVLGEVGAPGFFKRNGEFTLVQALTMANPSNFRSRLYDVRVVRGWPDHPRVIKVNVDRLLNGDLEHNMLLEPGDVIYVPQGRISYTLDFWNRLLAPVGGTASTIDEIQDIENE